jgi:molecular chaperone GrpE
MSTQEPVAGPTAAPEGLPPSPPDECAAACAAAKQPDPELEQARAEAADHYDRLLRTAAELDNLRKRTARIRVEAREDALRDVLLGIAPVLDNLNRALAQDTQDAAALRQGVELIRTQLLEVLKAQGFTPIQAVGEPFDPNLHEAMLELASDVHPPGTVIDQTETGYMLNTKLVRPARVIVSKPSQ